MSASACTRSVLDWLLSCCALVASSWHVSCTGDGAESIFRRDEVQGVPDWSVCSWTVQEVWCGTLLGSSVQFVGAWGDRWRCEVNVMMDKNSLIHSVLTVCILASIVCHPLHCYCCDFRAWTVPITDYTVHLHSAPELQIFVNYAWFDNLFVLIFLIIVCPMQYCRVTFGDPLQLFSL